MLTAFHAVDGPTGRMWRDRGRGWGRGLPRAWRSPKEPGLNLKNNREPPESSKQESDSHFRAVPLVTECKTNGSRGVWGPAGSPAPEAPVGAQWSARGSAVCVRLSAGSIFGIWRWIHSRKKTSFRNLGAGGSHASDLGICMVTFITTGSPKGSSAGFADSFLLEKSYNEDRRCPLPTPQPRGRGRAHRDLISPFPLPVHCPVPHLNLPLDLLGNEDPRKRSPLGHGP